MCPLLSVIVPVYNTKNYLSGCIESILNQTFKDIELLLVDDGSTDGSGAICDSFAKNFSNVRVIHQKNKGMIEARSVGVVSSLGRYITFVDSDDYIDKHSYEYAVHGMENDIDVICFGIRVRWADKDPSEWCITEEVKVYDKQGIEANIYPTLLWDVANNKQGFNPSCCLKVIKRELWIHSVHLIRGNFFRLGEELAFTAPMLYIANSIEVNNKVWYNYRIRPEGNLRAYFTRNSYFDDLYRIYQYLRAQFGNIPVFMEQIDCFYIWSVCLRRELYPRKEHNQYVYLFPFDKVNHGEKIILYGAGVVGQTYMEQIQRTSYCNVVLWVDANHEKYNELGVVSVSSILTVAYDKILIAISNQETIEDVKDNLLSMGVDFSRIIV